MLKKHGSAARFECRLCRKYLTSHKHRLRVHMATMHGVEQPAPELLTTVDDWPKKKAEIVASLMKENEAIAERKKMTAAIEAAGAKELSYERKVEAEPARAAEETKTKTAVGGKVVPAEGAIRAFF